MMKKLSLASVLLLHIFISETWGIVNDKAMGGSRNIGFNKKKHSTTVRPTWRPIIPNKLRLAQEKGYTAIPSNADEDPEFKYVWPDDYYDDYNFEYKKNMLEHGTFESKIQNYHDAEFSEALAKLRKQNEDEDEEGSGDIDEGQTSTITGGGPVTEGTNPVTVAIIPGTAPDTVIEVITVTPPSR